MRPFPAYELCYPFSQSSLRRLAYFFDCQSPITSETLAAMRVAWRAVEDWRQRHLEGSLIAQDTPDYINIVDTRPTHGFAEYRFSGPHRAVLRAADAAHSESFLYENVRSVYPFLTALELRGILQELLALDLLVREDELYLSLPLMPQTA